MRVISLSSRPAWRAAAARGLRSAAGSASRARLAAQNRPALRFPSGWAGDPPGQVAQVPAGGRAGWDRGACRWGSSRAVTAVPVQAAVGVRGADEVVGLAVDLGGRGQDVAAAGAEVQVAGGQVAVALSRSRGSRRAGRRWGCGRRRPRRRAGRPWSAWRMRRSRCRPGRARRRPGRRVRGRRWRWPGSSAGGGRYHAVIWAGSVVASRWPCAVAGVLRPAWQGNTGQPRAA